jgi:hypothetical protein
MNAATGQKIGIGGVGGSVSGVGGLSVASNSISAAGGISGVGMNSLNDAAKGLLNFNIQGTNGKLLVLQISNFKFLFDFLTNFFKLF